MKILEVIPTLGSGGAEKMVVELSNELAKDPNNEVELLTLYDLNEESCFHKFVNSKVKISSLSKKNGLDIGIFFKLCKKIKESRAEIVHLHVAAIPYALLSSFCLHKVSFFATIHSEARREAAGKFTTLARKIMFKLNKCIPVTISEKSKESFILFYQKKPQLIYNGIKKEIIDSRVGNPYLHYKGKIFLHIASVQPIKNQLALVKGFNRLINNGYNATLVMIGDANKTPEIYNQIKEYLSDRIIHLGVQTNPQFYLKFADAFCLTSLMEGMPMTLIESFAQGCIPICTPVGGICNMIVDGKNGILCSGTDEIAIYQALKRFFDLSDYQIQYLKENTLKSFDSYKIENTAKQYFKLFES